VAILGSASFDVTHISPNSIQLGGVNVAVRAPKISKLSYTLEDVNNDGFMDLSAVFSIPELVGAGVLTSATTSLVLTALYPGPIPVIEGTDSVRVVP